MLTVLSIIINAGTWFSKWLSVSQHQEYNTQQKYFFKLRAYCETKSLQMITIKVETLIISASHIHAVLSSPFKTVVICYVALIWYSIFDATASSMLFPLNRPQKHLRGYSAELSQHNGGQGFNSFLCSIIASAAQCMVTGPKLMPFKQH